MPISIATQPSTPLPALPLRRFAQTLEVSKTPIEKGLRSGLIPDLTPATLLALHALPILTEAQIDGVPLKVVRLGDEEPNGDPSRTHAGYVHGASDAAFLAACDRWWNRHKEILDTGVLLVAHASIVVAWLDVVGIRSMSHPQGGSGVWYHATLVARLDSVTGGRAVRAVDTKSPNLDAALKTVGSRLLGGRGGPITDAVSA